MKKHLLIGLAIGVFLVGMTGLAGATTFTDIWDPPNIYMTNSSSYSFIHDITDDGFTPGVVGNPGVDEITAATLYIYTYDNNDNPSEGYKITLDTTKLNSNYVITGGSTILNPDIHTYAFSVYTSLQSDGKLVVKIDGQNGDFYFAKSELTATWTDYVAPTQGVPEPATMLLLGTGLVGLAAVRRRRAKKS